LKLAVAVFLLFAAFFFFWYGYFIVSLVLAVVAAYIFLQKPAKSLGREFMRDMEGAEGQVPDKGVWEAGIKTAGGMAGAQTFSDKDNRTRLKDIEVTKWRLKSDKWGDAGKKTIELFKKLFG
jgi:hypothetical protein